MPGSLWWCPARDALQIKTMGAPIHLEHVVLILPCLGGSSNDALFVDDSTANRRKSTKFVPILKHTHVEQPSYLTRGFRNSGFHSL